MLIPVRIYKRSRKATAVSIASMVISLLLILVPVAVTIKIRTFNPLLFLLYAVCFGIAAVVISGRDRLSNQIAERDLLEHKLS